MAVVSRLTNVANGVPYYLGTQTNKRAGTAKGAHSHYILISPLVAARLGMPKKSTIKQKDEAVGGAIFDTNRTYTDANGAKKKTDAKRYIQKCSKQVELFTGNYVKNVNTKNKGKGAGLEPESYTVGFPSSLTMIEILFFINKRMPNVTIVRSGKKSYVPKNITVPKDIAITAEPVKEVKEVK